MAEGVVVIWSHNGWKWQHGVIRVDMGSISCGLLDRLHLFFAPSVIQRTHHDWLPNSNVSGGGQVGLLDVSLGKNPMP